VGGVPTPLEPAPATLADGRELWLKREDEHELGAFKWRGALPVIESLAAADHQTVVTASTGNHGAAVAWAAGRCGVKVTVFAPADASATKLALLESLSATIRLVDGDLDFAKEEARRFAARERLPFFEDGAEPLQYEGYAQIAIELLAQLPQPAAVVIPVGNGALAGGVGSILGTRSPSTDRIAVVAKAMPVMADSFEQGRPAEGEGATIADGLAVRVAIPLAVERLAAAVDRFVRVSERAIAAALVRCADAGLIVEPAASAAFAALQTLDAEGPLVIVVTGRNVDDELLERARDEPQSFSD
jgi:threonine dehydratase